MTAYIINLLADDKILGLPKLKAIADYKLDVTQNVKVIFHRIENSVGKGENANYQHFLFPTMFSKAFFLQCVESRHCMVGLNFVILGFTSARLWLRKDFPNDTVWSRSLPSTKGIDSTIHQGKDYH